jgi:hypothetical protein
MSVRGLATSDRTGFRAFEAELHRVRGEILLKRNPANAAPAEDAFLTALAVAKQQGTRSFELRAARGTDHGAIPAQKRLRNLAHHRPDL